MTQRELNKIFTKPIIELDFLYSDLTSCFLVIVSGCFTVRPLPILGFFFIFFQNIVDKLQVYKRTKEPPKDSYILAKKMRRLVVGWTPLIYTVCRLLRLYIYKTRKDNIPFIYHMINLGILIFVLTPTHRICEHYLEKMARQYEISKEKFKSKVDVKKVVKTLEARERRKKRMEENLYVEEEACDKLLFRRARKKNLVKLRMNWIVIMIGQIL